MSQQQILGYDYPPSPRQVVIINLFELYDFNIYIIRHAYKTMNS